MGVTEALVSFALYSASALVLFFVVVRLRTNTATQQAILGALALVIGLQLYQSSKSGKPYVKKQWWQLSEVERQQIRNREARIVKSVAPTEKPRNLQMEYRNAVASLLSQGFERADVMSLGMIEAVDAVRIQNGQPTWRGPRRRLTERELADDAKALLDAAKIIDARRSIHQRGDE